MAPDSAQPSTTPSFVSDLQDLSNPQSPAKSYVPLGTVITSLLAPEKFEEHIGDSVNDSPDKAVWVVADGREVRGSGFSKLTGESRVPNLVGHAIQDTQVVSGKLMHAESLLGQVTKPNRDWKWLISLREADPKTPYPEWEQRLQRIRVSSENPHKIHATAEIFEAKHKRWAGETACAVHYLGVSVREQPVYWYVKIN